MTGKGGSNQRGLGAISQVLKRQVLELKVTGMRIDSIRNQEEAAIFNSGDSVHKETLNKLGLNTIAHRSALLHELIAKDSFTGAIWLALLILGLLIEIIPIISKLATPKSAYELDLDAYEEVLANRRKSALQKSNFYAGLSYQQQLIDEAIQKTSFYPFK